MSLSRRCWSSLSSRRCLVDEQKLVGHQQGVHVVDPRVAAALELLVRLPAVLRAGRLLPLDRHRPLVLVVRDLAQEARKAPPRSGQILLPMRN